MCLLAEQGGIICALLCTSDFLHPRHSTVPCIMQNTSVFRSWMLFCAPPPHPLPPMRRTLCSTGETSPPKRPQSPTMADDALVVLCQKKPANMHPNRQFPVLWFTCPRVCMSCFVLRIPCIAIGGARGLSLGVCSLGGARIPPRTDGDYTRRVGGNLQLPPPPHPLKSPVPCTTPSREAPSLASKVHNAKAKFSSGHNVF